MDVYKFEGQVSRDQFKALDGQFVEFDAQIEYVETVENEDYIPVPPFIFMEPEEYEIHKLTVESTDGKPIEVTVTLEGAQIKKGQVTIGGTLQIDADGSFHLDEAYI